MKTKQQSYIPAFKYHWLTRFYDPLIAGVMKEATFKTPLVNQALLRPQQRILDLGCGTGTLTLMIKRAQPEAEIIGLDADSEILGIARKKAEQARIPLLFQQGMSFDLPFSDHSFDHVFSSLFFHHLTLEMKQKTLQEVFRVLRPKGEMHVVDFGKPYHHGIHLNFLFFQLLGNFKRTKGHTKELLPDLFCETGFESISQTGQYNTILGTLQSYFVRKCK